MVIGSYCPLYLTNEYIFFPCSVHRRFLLPIGLRSGAAAVFGWGSRGQYEDLLPVFFAAVVQGIAKTLLGTWSVGTSYLYPAGL